MSDLEMRDAISEEKKKVMHVNDFKIECNDSTDEFHSVRKFVVFVCLHQNLPFL
jgi:hypothetical protein